MTGISKRYSLIMAKTDKNHGDYWLPLWMHLRDTAGVMEKLVRKWVPESVMNSCGLEYDDFFKTAVFLAASHDCGKATSYFQSIISLSSNEMFQKMNESGLLVKRHYKNAGKTPHAFAGQCILENGIPDISIHDSVATVIGAHHGKPMDVEGIFFEDLLEDYPVNFFGTEKGGEQKIIWETLWKEIVLGALEISEMKDSFKLPRLHINAQVLLSGLLIVADWLASNTYYFPLISFGEYVDDSI